MAVHSFGDLCGPRSSFFSVISPNSSRARQLPDLLSVSIARKELIAGLDYFVERETTFAAAEREPVSNEI